MNTEEKIGILSTVLDVPTPLKVVTMAPRNSLERILTSLKVKTPTKKMLYLNDLKASTCRRLAGHFQGLIVSGDEALGIDGVMRFINLNTYQMALIVAEAIHNQDSPVPAHLIETVAGEFTNTELKPIMVEIKSRLNADDLFRATSLAASLAVM